MQKREGLEKIKRLKDPSNRKLAKLAVRAEIWVVAVGVVFSIGIGSWAEWRSMRQDRLSVMPLMRIRTLMDNSPTPYVAIKLRNEGLGPAIIRSVVIVADGERYSHWHLIKNMLALDRPVALYYQEEISAGEVLRAGSEETVFKISLDKQHSDKDQQSMHELFSRIGYLVCYCSLYEDCKYISYKVRDADAKKWCEINPDISVGDGEWHPG